MMLTFDILVSPSTQRSEVDCRRLIEEKLRSLLEALDTDTLTASAKIWVYHHFVASKLSWSLLINDLCLTFDKKLQAIATKSLKRWVGLPKCANPSILFVGGRDQCGLKVRNLITLCSNSTSSSACSNPPRTSAADSSLKIWLVDSPNGHESSPRPEKRKSPKLLSSRIPRKQPLSIPPRRLLIVLHRLLERYANG